MYVSVKSQICFCFHYFTYNLCLSRSTHCRLKWQLIRALQMFVEHVVLKHEGMLPYLRRLQLVSIYFSCAHISTVVRIFHFPIQHLKSDADFLKASTVDRVKKHLNSMDSELKKKLKYAKLLRCILCQLAVKPCCIHEYNKLGSKVGSYETSSVLRLLQC